MHANVRNILVQDYGIFDMRIQVRKKLIVYVKIIW